MTTTPINRDSWISTPPPLEALNGGANGNGTSNGTRGSTGNATSGAGQPQQGDDDDLSLADRIAQHVDLLLQATLDRDDNAIDAEFSELYKLGISRDRCQERILMRWAESKGYNLSQCGTEAPARGRVMGQAKGGRGLRQQIPGFAIDRDLHLLVADASGGKTTALAELATVYSARDRGFLDHEGPRSDHPDDPRTTVLVIASDGEASAYDMWDDYFATLDAYDRGLKVEIWAQDDETGEVPWNVALPNLDRLVKRLKQGDVVAVFIDTANSVFRGAGINVGVGPIETYLRLLKQIVCRHAALWLAHHTNRNAGADMKAIGGHPAFQEVPTVVHLIEAKRQADGSLMRVWHVLKLRGQPYRRFSYELSEGQLKVTEGHYFENCSDEVLVLIDTHQRVGTSTRPAALLQASKRPKQSIYNALSDLRSRKLIRPKGTGYRVTDAGHERIAYLRV
jgi:hypothetical protein